MLHSVYATHLGHASHLVTTCQLGSVTSKSFDYVDCQLREQIDLPFNNNNSISSTPFDLINYYVWACIHSHYGGSHYFVNFMNN